MCGYFYIGFKSFSDDTSLFSPNEYKKNDKIIFSIESIVTFPINIENLKTLKYDIFLKNHEVFLLFTICVVMNIKNL